MPKDTFHNLPEEKRLLIENVAIDEFATHGYDNASINRIVAGSRIAKGSFYQYFEDKYDLFKHIILCTGEQKLQFLSPILQDPTALEFMTLLEEMYRASLLFAREYPCAAQVGNLVYQSREHPVLKEVFTENVQTAMTFFASLLKLAIERGELRADIDTSFIAHMLVSMNFSLLEYYFDVVKDQAFNMGEMDDDLMQTVHLSLDFVKHGICIPTEGVKQDD